MRERASEARRQMLRADLLSAPERCIQQGVLELADVPWPCVIEQ
jgi:hypothetical protein